MLNKTNRLTKRKEFSYIYKNAKSVSNKNIVLFYIPTKLKNPKIGISVSKKVGKAILRNKIKRQLREIIRKLLPSLNQKYNYVFVARENISELKYTEIESNVENALKKANLISTTI